MDVIVRQQAVTFRLGHFAHPAQPIELSKTVGHVAVDERLHDLFIIPALTLDVLDFRRDQAGLLFEQPERRASFDRAMLPPITRKNDAHVELVGQVEDPGRGFRTEQSRFIDPENVSLDGLL